jgi:hypothetical protein
MSRENWYRRWPSWFRWGGVDPAPRGHVTVAAFTEHRAGVRPREPALSGSLTTDQLVFDPVVRQHALGPGWRHPF